MRFHHSLHFKVATGIVAVTILLLAIFFVWDYRFHRRQLMEELQKSATSLSNITMHGLVEIAMMGKHPELLQRGIQSLGDDSSVSGIFVIDRSGTVRLSKNQKQLGRRYHLQHEGCRECHSASGAPPGIFCRLDGEEVLRYAIPIPNRKECHCQWR